MKLSLARIWLGTFAILVIASTTSFADRIQLVQGRRLVKDKLSFTVEVLHDKNESPRYANAPEDIQIYLAFADRPATGFVYLDGKVVGLGFVIELTFLHGREKLVNYDVFSLIQY